MYIRKCTGTEEQANYHPFIPLCRRNTWQWPTQQRFEGTPPPNFMIKIWASDQIWFWRKQIGISPLDITWVLHLHLQFLTGCSHPKGMKTDYFPSRFLQWAPLTKSFCYLSIVSHFPTPFPNPSLYLMYRAPAFLGKPWRTLHLTPSFHHKRTENKLFILSVTVIFSVQYRYF